MKIEKILYATDFTEGSERAASYALDLAKRYGATLIVLNVIYDIARTAGWNASHIDMDTLYGAMEQGARKEIDIIADKLRADYPQVETVVIRGLPNDDVISFAVEHKVDMIVIGTHGRKGIDRLLFGSTASKIVKASPCPVLTVRG